MAETGLRKRMIVNTISNYGRLILSILITIFLTRILFLGLSREEYGIWALLWSIFGYSLLLDFGFGAAVQKETSQTMVNQDWKRYNRLLSTVFINYLFMGLLIALASIILANNIDKLFQFNNESDINYYRKVFVIFGVGTSIVFPFGFFMEVLRGLHKIKMRNFISMAYNILNFIFMYIVIQSGLALIGMTIVTILISLLTNFTMAYFAYKSIPTLKISWKFYDFKLLKNVMSFSLFAYIITFSNLIIFRTDQLVISFFASVSLVAVYQISSRLATTFRNFSSQFLDNLAPVAATLFASNKEQKLSKIMIESNRLMGFISTLLFIPLIVFVQPLLKIWLELSDPDGLLVAIILMISMYILVFFRSTSVRIILMSDHYKNLSIIAIVECVANLALSILLINYTDLGIVGVALGTLIPNLILAVSFNIPIGLKFSKITFKEYFQQSVWKTLWIGIISLLFALFIRKIFYPTNFLMLFSAFIIVIIFYLLLYYRFGTLGWERKQFTEFLKAKFFRK